MKEDLRVRIRNCGGRLVHLILNLGRRGAPGVFVRTAALLVMLLSVASFISIYFKHHFLALKGRQLFCNWLGLNAALHRAQWLVLDCGGRCRAHCNNITVVGISLSMGQFFFSQMKSVLAAARSACVILNLVLSKTTYCYSNPPLQALTEQHKPALPSVVVLS